jgi:uncharacterized protein (DUF342 family)
MIHGAQVKVSGTVTVDGGIVTNESGWVRASGDIKAGFVENSHLYCGGSISIAKSIITSFLQAHGHVTVTDPEGLLVGGRIECFKDLTSANIGRVGGARTIITVGIDPKARLRLAKYEARLDKIHKAMVAKQAGLREYRKKSDAQITAKQAEVKADLVLQIEQCQRLLTKIQANIDRAKSEITVNEDVKIEVSKLLSANCQIKVGEQKVPVPSDLIGVVVTGKRKNGSFITALQEVSATDKAS